MYTSLFLAVSDGDVGNPWKSYTDDFNVGWDFFKPAAGKIWWVVSNIWIIVPYVLGRISPSD